MTQQLRSEQRADYADNTSGDITGATHQNFVDSAFFVDVRTVTAETASVTTDDDYVRLDTTANTVTLTLPALASAGQQQYTFKWVAGANAATLDGNSTEQIEGSDTYVFADLLDAVILRPGPTQWEVVSEILHP